MRHFLLVTILLHTLFLAPSQDYTGPYKSRRVCNLIFSQKQRLAFVDSINKLIDEKILYHPIVSASKRIDTSLSYTDTLHNFKDSTVTIFYFDTHHDIIQSITRGLRTRDDFSRLRIYDDYGRLIFYEGQDCKTWTLRKRWHYDLDGVLRVSCTFSSSSGFERSQIFEKKLSSDNQITLQEKFFSLNCGCDF